MEFYINEDRVKEFLQHLINNFNTEKRREAQKNKWSAYDSCELASFYSSTPADRILDTDYFITITKTWEDGCISDYNYCINCDENFTIACTDYMHHDRFSKSINDGISVLGLSTNDLTKAYRKFKSGVFGPDFRSECKKWLEERKNNSVADYDKQISDIDTF